MQCSNSAASNSEWFLIIVTVIMEQFLEPEKLILAPETDIMGERNYIDSLTLILSQVLTR